MGGWLGGTDRWMKTVVYQLSARKAALIVELRLEWFVSPFRLAVTVLLNPVIYQID